MQLRPTNEYTTEVMDHHGLVAAVCRDLKIAEEIDDALLEITTNPYISQFPKGLERSIAKCNAIMATYKAEAEPDAQFQSSPKI